SRGPGDLKQLAAAILERLASRRRRLAPELDEDVWKVLERHAWPGNVRELENTLERMLVAAGAAPTLSREDLPAEFGAGERGLPAQREPSAREITEALERAGFHRGRTASELGLSRHQLYRRLKAMAGARPAPPSPTHEDA